MKKLFSLLLTAALLCSVPTFAAEAEPEASVSSMEEISTSADAQDISAANEPDEEPMDNGNSDGDAPLKEAAFADAGESALSERPSGEGNVEDLREEPDEAALIPASENPESVESEEPETPANEEAESAVEDESEVPATEDGDAVIDEDSGVPTSAEEESAVEDKSEAVAGEAPETEDAEASPAFPADVTIPATGRIILNPYRMPVEMNGNSYSEQVVSEENIIVSAEPYSLIMTAEALATFAESSSVELVSTPDDLSDHAKTLFVWFEFQLLSDLDAKPQWSGVYTGAENQIVVNAGKANVLILPAAEGDSPTYAAFRAFGTAMTPLGMLWEAQDLANFKVSFAFAPEFPDEVPTIEDDEPVEDAESSEVEEPVEDAEPSEDEEPVENAKPSEVEEPVQDAQPVEDEEPVHDAELSSDTEIVEDAAESFQD